MKILLIGVSTLALAVSMQAQQATYRKADNGRVLENDLKVTPGAVRTVSVTSICDTKTATLRSVSDSTKKQVFALYNVKCGEMCGKQYEVDHLISLEIGGTNDIANLWPQPYAVPGAHQKDVLENKLHSMICSKQITPADAQKAISHDWWAAYLKYASMVDAKREK